MTPGLVEALERELGSRISGHTRVPGGDIANAARVTTREGGVVFVKWTTADGWPLLEAEADGLEALRRAKHRLIVPHVLVLGRSDCGEFCFEALPWITRSTPDRAYWRDLGRGLSELHASTGEAFGWPRDNFIGGLPQRNARSGIWPQFFAECRLVPQMETAVERGHWRVDWTAPFEDLLRRLGDILPSTPPSALLHGDLWSGNAMPCSDGAAVLDPAVYRGDREADLAMTELFGGFDSAFYEAYMTEWPMAPGYVERREIYNLYHLLNHLNHFGSGYADSVARTLVSFA